MNILIAPDSFKESLSARAVATALATGIEAALPGSRCDLAPLADGGEGTVEALVAATGGHLQEATVTGPLGQPVVAAYGVLGGSRTAVIEMAAASGLALVPPAARDPLRTTSVGTGELIRHALTGIEGLETLVIGLGGSATVDGGAGLCQALGVRFFGRDGQALTAPLGGGALADIAAIDLDALDPRLAAVTLEVACDVDNPLLGPAGAASVFGPQKGATPAQVDRLEHGLTHLFDLIEGARGTRVRDLPGSGAAGGMGAALRAVFGARLRPGIEIVIDALGLPARVAAADLVITGEGRLDRQTLHGKAPCGVARLARRLGVPVIGVGGSIEPGCEPALATIFDAVEACVTAPQTTAEALAAAAPNLERAGFRIGCWLRVRR